MSMAFSFTVICFILVCHVGTQNQSGSFINVTRCPSPHLFGPCNTFRHQRRGRGQTLVKYPVPWLERDITESVTARGAWRWPSSVQRPDSEPLLGCPPCWLACQLLVHVKLGGLGEPSHSKSQITLIEQPGKHSFIAFMAWKQGITSQQCTSAQWTAWYMYI